MRFRKTGTTYFETNLQQIESLMENDKSHLLAIVDTFLRYPPPKPQLPEGMRRLKVCYIFIREYTSTRYYATGRMDPQSGL
jgi:hypothetical protein